MSSLIFQSNRTLSRLEFIEPVPIHLKNFDDHIFISQDLKLVLFKNSNLFCLFFLMKNVFFSVDYKKPQMKTLTQSFHHRPCVPSTAWLEDICTMLSLPFW